MRYAAHSGMDIRGLIGNSLVEWEGRICAVVFTGGCNWRCPYCHGWRFVVAPEKLEPVPEEKVFDLLRRQNKWLDGVAITGGEPTLQPGLERFIAGIKELGKQVKLETNGTNPAVLRRLLEAKLLDCLCLDYKAPLNERLAAATGTAPGAERLEEVRESFRLAAASGLEREYHTTLCPAFIDAGALEEMGEELEPGGLWVLQQYELEERLSPEAAGELRYDAAELELLAAVARRRHEKVLLRKGKGA